MQFVFLASEDKDREACYGVIQNELLSELKRVMAKLPGRRFAFKLMGDPLVTNPNPNSDPDPDPNPNPNPDPNPDPDPNPNPNPNPNITGRRHSVEVTCPPPPSRQV